MTTRPHRKRACIRTLAGSLSSTSQLLRGPLLKACIHRCTCYGAREPTWPAVPIPLATQRLTHLALVVEVAVLRELGLGLVPQERVLEHRVVDVHPTHLQATRRPWIECR